MAFLTKHKSRRLRGAELVVTGGATVFLANVVGWLAPAALCVYGAYRWFLKKSYKDGVTSVAVGILLLTLFSRPIDFVLDITMLAGGLLLGVGAVMMILPSKKADETSDEVEVVPEKVEDHDA